MKIKTYQLTLAVLAAIVGAGVGSGYFAYKLGAEAIKGVNSPDINPSKRFSASAQASERPKEFKPLNEKDIIKKVETYIQQSKNKPKAQEVSQTQPTPSPQATPSPSEQTQEILNKFPLTVQDQNMTLEITQARYQSGSLILDISLKNAGKQAVKFLYSFLEVQDSQGQILSAITDGLPEEIPANGESFKGTVEIPTALIEQSKLISLKLTDYPDQKLKLNLSDIPIRLTN